MPDDLVSAQRRTEARALQQGSLLNPSPTAKASPKCKRGQTFPITSSAHFIVFTRKDRGEGKNSTAGAGSLTTDLT